MKHVSMTVKSAMVLFCLAGLTACQHTNVAEPMIGEATARNSVQMVRLPYEITSEEDGTASLSSVTKTALSGFLSSIEVSYADVLVLDAPNAPHERIKAIESYIKESGLIYAGTSALGAEPKAGSVMLYVERYIVTTPKCGAWIPEANNDTRNNASSFLGCSNTANLGLMVANPRDLVAGQSAGNTTSAAVSAIYTPAPSAATAGAAAIGNLGALMGAMAGAPAQSGGNQ